MSYGERYNRLGEIRSDKFSKVCPECGIVANSRYYNHAASKWVYKHTRLEKNEKGLKRVFATIYHHADK